MTHPDKLRERRLRLKMTQARLVEVLGVATPRVCEWEREVRTPKPLTQEGIFTRLRELERKGKKK